MGLGDEASRSRCAAWPSRGTWNEAVWEPDEAEADGRRADDPVGASRGIIARAKEAGSPSEAAQIRHGEKRRLARVHGTKWCLYHFRHSFATRMLEAGTDALTVSALLGHTDGAMLAKVYSHLSKNGAYLRHVIQTAGMTNATGRSLSSQKPS